MGGGNRPDGVVRRAAACIDRNPLPRRHGLTYALLVDTPVRELGVAGVAAMTVMFSAALVAGRLIWLMTTDPVSIALLATADDVWSLLAGVAQRLLAII